jgi:hypothetical protein
MSFTSKSVVRGSFQSCGGRKLCAVMSILNRPRASHRVFFYIDKVVKQVENLGHGAGVDGLVRKGQLTGPAPVFTTQVVTL